MLLGHAVSIVPSVSTLCRPGDLLAYLQQSQEVNTSSRSECSHDDLLDIQLVLVDDQFARQRRVRLWIPVHDASIVSQLQIEICRASALASIHVQGQFVLSP